jgi:hypothetical protein
MEVMAESTLTGMLSCSWTRSMSNQPKQTAPARNGQNGLSALKTLILFFFFL